MRGSPTSSIGSMKREGRNAIKQGHPIRVKLRTDVTMHGNKGAESAPNPRGTGTARSKNQGSYKLVKFGLPVSYFLVSAHYQEGKIHALTFSISIGPVLFSTYRKKRCSERDFVKSVRRESGLREGDVNVEVGENVEGMAAVFGAVSWDRRLLRIRPTRVVGF